MENLEAKIKTKLKEHSLTIEKLAVYSGVTKQTMHNIFKKDDVKLSHLRRIAQVLNVNVDYFISSGDNTKRIDKESSQLWTEVNSLKRENNLLREMLELIKHKEAV
ncbi:helix-turn-helix domain-containing protein [Cyclobacteriaceae bacterium]|nr:helix-turn-helix domain-containing protein [Cyclobacteriaceae bacterium]